VLGWDAHSPSDEKQALHDAHVRSRRVTTDWAGKGCDMNDKVRLSYATRWLKSSLALVPLLAAPACASVDESKVDASRQAVDLALAVTGTTLFEAAPVRPVALVERGELVAVTNTPADRLELFKPERSGVKRCGSVPVGMRPVAALAMGEEVWVVNHLSDSVSVVALDARRCSGTVVRTLLVGDEPRDIVSAKNRAGKSFVFVTAAHRGQNVRGADGAYRDPQLTTPGVGRADVFVFDPARLGTSGGEKPLKVISLFTDTPRGLAVGDGKVYASGFLSGNQTAVVRYQLVIDRGRKSFAKLDADGDLQLDATLPVSERTIEGGYPAVQGHGRCISAQTTTPPSQARNDFIMDVCVKTDPANPYRALGVVPQVAGQVTPECSCTNGLGELQRTPPLIVRFYEDPEVCGANFDTSKRGCWLEPPQDDGPLGLQAAQQWNQEVPFSLPDRDVFSIDVEGSEPELSPSGDFRKVGTTLFNLAVHPASGKLYVGNTEARNHVRFEGPGQNEPQDAHQGNTTVRGHIAESRITVIDPESRSVTPLHLNAHIDYRQCCAPTPNAEAERSLAFPVSLAISSKRDRRGRIATNQDLYVAALGSDKVAVLPTEKLDSALPGQLIQDQSMHIRVPGGPIGLTLDEQRERLYVLAHFTNELVVVSTSSRRILERSSMFSPEPQAVRDGRPFLYDARRTSSHGDSACASCHIFGDLDGLAWDLGDPNAAEVKNPGPFFSRPEILSAPLSSHFLALKGPMTTQSLRGMANHGVMHWRGDRRAAGATSQQPDTGAYDEVAAFTAFNPAFPGLNGRSAVLSDADMLKFTKFVLQLTYPPNPVRALDSSLDAAEQRARSRYFGCEITDASMLAGECADGRNIEQETHGCNCLNPPEFVLGIVQRPADCPPDPRCTLDVSDFQHTCHGCHTLDPNGNKQFGVDKPGFFGSDGRYTNDAVPHILKIPHLRNAYQKVGMFGSIRTPAGIGLTSIADSVLGARRGGLLAPQNAHMGDQLRGFGFTHAGEEDTLFHFFSLTGFARSASPGFPFVNDNRGGFEPVMPLDHRTCFDTQLPVLNGQFLARLAPPAQLQQVSQWLGIVLDPSSSADAKAQASQQLGAFLQSLPSDNPGSVFQRLPLQSAVSQLALPLFACGAVPNSSVLEGLGCFDLAPSAACAPLLNTVRGCSLWGATLEELLPNGVQACFAAGLRDKADMEAFVFSFDSNVKPIVGQQVTVKHGEQAPAASARLTLLVERATAGDCDLVAHGEDHGYLYRSGRLRRDDGTELTLAQALRHERRLTYTAVPVGEGRALCERRRL
jgi:DNA-binding beta-propeller fold protein YncE